MQIWILKKKKKPKIYESSWVLSDVIKSWILINLWYFIYSEIWLNLWDLEEFVKEIYLNHSTRLHINSYIFRVKLKSIMIIRNP